MALLSDFPKKILFSFAGDRQVSGPFCTYFSLMRNFPQKKKLVITHPLGHVSKIPGNGINSLEGALGNCVMKPVSCVFKRCHPLFGHWRVALRGTGHSLVNIVTAGQCWGGMPLPLGGSALLFSSSIDFCFIVLL